MQHLYHDETPPDEPDICPLCGEPLDWRRVCPNWREHYEDRYGPDWDD